MDEENKWVNVRIPQKLLQEVDDILEKTSYINNSRFVDAAVREKIHTTKEEQKGVSP